MPEAKELTNNVVVTRDKIIEIDGVAFKIADLKAVKVSAVKSDRIWWLAFMFLVLAILAAFTRQLVGPGSLLGELLNWSIVFWLPGIVLLIYWFSTMRYEVVIKDSSGYLKVYSTSKKSHAESIARAVAENLSK